MQAITGTIDNGSIKLKNPIPVEDGTSVLVFVLPKVSETKTTESLFGKWSWYTEKIDNEVHNAWKTWEETSPV